VEAGLEKTFQVDAMNDRWETPLMVAASHGHHDAVRLLLGNERKPALEMRDSAGRTPLMLAARNGQGAVVQMLLAHGADLHAHDRQGWTALMHAAVRNDAETMEALLAAGATIGAFRPANLDPAQWSELARRIDAVVGLLQMRTPPHAW
jgi:ankyrin repeat protein